MKKDTFAARNHAHAVEPPQTFADVARQVGCVAKYIRTDKGVCAEIEVRGVTRKISTAGTSGEVRAALWDLGFHKGNVNPNGVKKVEKVAVVAAPAKAEVAARKPVAPVNGFHHFNGRGGERPQPSAPIAARNSVAAVNGAQHHNGNGAHQPKSYHPRDDKLWVAIPSPRGGYHVVRAAERDGTRSAPEKIIERMKETLGRKAKSHQPVYDRTQWHYIVAPSASQAARMAERMHGACAKEVKAPRDQDVPAFVPEVDLSDASLASEAYAPRYSRHYSVSQHRPGGIRGNRHQHRAML